MKRIILERCICCDVLFLNIEGDYPFCETCMIAGNRGFNSTVPTEKESKVLEILMEEKC